MEFNIFSSFGIDGMDVVDDGATNEVLSRPNIFFSSPSYISRFHVNNWPNSYNHPAHVTRLRNMEYISRCVSWGVVVREEYPYDHDVLPLYVAKTQGTQGVLYQGSLKPILSEESLPHNFNVSHTFSPYYKKQREFRVMFICGQGAVKAWEKVYTGVKPLAADADEWRIRDENFSWQENFDITHIFNTTTYTSIPHKLSLFYCVCHFFMTETGGIILHKVHPYLRTLLYSTTDSERTSMANLVLEAAIKDQETGGHWATTPIKYGPGAVRGAISD